MSWLSVFLRGGGKKTLLVDLLSALLDGKITESELKTILAKVGLGVVNAGLAGDLKRLYDLTEPTKLRTLAEKNVDLALAEVSKAHSILGLLLGEV